jgi:sterol desaturase/sphingolipid hydroxylase (fatty acid hydroxylase superfamily)
MDLLNGSAHTVITVVKNAARSGLLDVRDTLTNPLSDVGWLGALRFLAYGFVVLTLKIGYDYVDAKPRLLPRKIYLSRSFAQDIGVVLVNAAFFGVVAALFMSSDDGADLVIAAVQSAVNGLGEALFGGSMVSLGGHDSLTRIICVVGSIFAVDVANYTHHYLSHRVPWLWEFHKVHHSAEVLNPVTSRRVHFVEMLYRALIVALFLGLFTGCMRYVLGPSAKIGANVAAGVTIYFGLFAYGQVLNHSHIWWSWGKLEYLFNSPAMHAIHHSRDPRHFNKNLGGLFTFLDLLVGTLYKTTKEPEPLQLGIDEAYDWKSASQRQLFIRPFQALWARVSRAPVQIAMEETRTAPRRS